MENRIDAVTLFSRKNYDTMEIAPAIMDAIQQIQEKSHDVNIAYPKR